MNDRITHSQQPESQRQCHCCQTCGSEDVRQVGESLVCCACGAVLADSSQRLETFSQSLVTALVSGARLKAVASAANVRYSSSQPLMPPPKTPQQQQQGLHVSHSQPLFPLAGNASSVGATAEGATEVQPASINRKRKRDEACSYTLSELYQVILSSQADALIQLGAAPAAEFRSGLFRLWCLYLSCTREAFDGPPPAAAASSSSGANPKPAKGWGGLILPELGSGGGGRGRTVRQKRMRPDRIADTDMADTLAQLSAAGGDLRDLGLARGQESDDSDADFFTNITDDNDNDDDSDDFEGRSLTSQSVARSLQRLKRHNADEFAASLKSPGLRSEFRACQLASPGQPLLRARLAGQKLNETNLALLYLACQLESPAASPISCLSHLLELVATGRLPYFDALRRLPERYCVTEPGVAAMLRRSSAPRYDSLVEIVSRLSDLLGIQIFPRHRFFTICSYVINRMGLPEQLLSFVSRLAIRLLSNYSARHPLSNQSVSCFEIKVAKSTVYFEADKLAISLVLLALCYLCGIGCPESLDDQPVDLDHHGDSEPTDKAEDYATNDTDNEVDDCEESDVSSTSSSSSTDSAGEVTDDYDEDDHSDAQVEDDFKLDLSNCTREEHIDKSSADVFQFENTQKLSPSFSPCKEQDELSKVGPSKSQCTPEADKESLFDYTSWFGDYRSGVQSARICDRPAWYPDYLAWADSLLPSDGSNSATAEVGGDDWPAETRAELGQPSVWRRPELRDAVAAPLREFLRRRQDKDPPSAQTACRRNFRLAKFSQLLTAHADSSDVVDDLSPFLVNGSADCRCPRRLRRLIDTVRLDFRVAFRRDSFLQFMRRFDSILRCPIPESGRFFRNKSLETLHLS